MVDSGGPLSTEEVKQFMEYVKRHEQYGCVELKTEAGKTTRVTVTRTLLPNEIRQMMRI